MGQKHATSTLIHASAIPFLLFAIKQSVGSNQEEVVKWSLTLLLSMIECYIIEQDEFARQVIVGCNQKFT